MQNLRPKKTRLKMWEKNKLCHWCGIVTVYTRNVQDNQATIDHLYHKLDPRRQTPQGRSAKVIACWKCNNERGRLGCLEFGKPRGTKATRKKKKEFQAQIKKFDPAIDKPDRLIIGSARKLTFRLGGS